MFVQARATATNSMVSIHNVDKGDGPPSGAVSIVSILLSIAFELLTPRPAHWTGMAIEPVVLLGRSPYLVASIVLIAVVPIVSWLLQCNQRPKTFPPGPPTVPILGNIHQMPTKHSYLKFAVST